MDSRNWFFEKNLLPTTLKTESDSSDNWSIACAVIAYGAGDAFGAAHEFVDNPPAVIESTLLAKPDWPYGGVSDDTTLSLLTIDSLEESDPAGAAQRYLESLRASQESLRGLGPTTRFALGMSVKEEEQHLIGVSNGGMMRSALIGCVFQSSESARREEWVRTSVAATHQKEAAIEAALMLSGLFSQAISDPASFVYPTLNPEWSPPDSGISLDPMESYYAVIYVASSSHSVEDAFLRACTLGGDTDTVAALSGALVAALLRSRSGLFEIPWLQDVNWDEIPQMKRAIEILIRRRDQWGN